MNRNERAVWYFLLILVVLLLTIVTTTACSSVQDRRTCTIYDTQNHAHQVACEGYPFEH